jgi:hypothetical protein
LEAAALQGQPPAHPHPSGTTGWKKLYRQRGAEERDGGRLKAKWALLPLQVRRIEQFGCTPT